MISTFRFMLPGDIDPLEPFEIHIQQSRAIKRIVMFSDADGFLTTDAGFRLFAPDQMLVPGAGSVDVDAPPRWCTLPYRSFPLTIDLDTFSLPDEPYLLTMQFYNQAGNIIGIAGLIYT